MRLVDKASHFPNLQHQLQYNFGLLVGQDFVQVEAYITNEGITLTDVPALIKVLQIAFGDADRVVTAEQKPEILKETKLNFSNYYTEFQHYTADVQGNNTAKCTTLMRCLNTEIKDALTLSDKVPQLFQEFVAFLQRLDN
jgi:predicted butyrate kinase (DUF1464 family)